MSASNSVLSRGLSAWDSGGRGPDPKNSPWCTISMSASPAAAIWNSSSDALTPDATRCTEAAPGTCMPIGSESG